MRVLPVDPADPAARRLIALLDAYQAALYPAESNHLDSIETLRQPNVHFVGGYVGDALVACGAYKRLDDDGAYGEIKRVFVLDGERGKGYSKRIMEALEARMAAEGLAIARLETGIHQPEAIALYRRLGYVERGPFGAYAADPLSLFMEKMLGV